MVWFGCIVFNGTLSTSRPYRATVGNILGLPRAGEQDKHTVKQWRQIL